MKGCFCGLFSPVVAMIEFYHNLWEFRDNFFFFIYSRRKVVVGCLMDGSVGDRCHYQLDQSLYHMSSMHQKNNLQAQCSSVAYPTLLLIVSLKKVFFSWGLCVMQVGVNMYIHWVSTKNLDLYDHEAFEMVVKST